MTTVCISQSYSDALRNQFHQSEAEQIIVFILTPFVYISAIINVLFFLRGKKRTQPPADVLLFVTIFGVIRMTSYLAGSIYDTINPAGPSSPVPVSFSQFCQGTGFTNVMCEIAHFVYNVVFCVYYIVKIRNPLKSWIKDNKGVHVCCLVVIVVVTVVFYWTNLIGVSVLGVCGYRFGAGSIYIDIILSTIYFLNTIISSLFFLRYLRTISKQSKSTHLYVKYYFKYCIIASIVYLVGVVSLFVVTVKCLEDQSDDVFEGLVILCNVSRLVVPIMVLGVIAGHPEMKMVTVFRYLTKVFNYKRRNGDEPVKFKPNRSSFYPDHPQSNQRATMLIELNSLNNPHLYELDFLSRIKDRSKACLLHTILGCLALQEIQQFQKLSSLTEIKQSTEEEKLQSHTTSIRTSTFRFSNIQLDHFDGEQINGWNFNQTDSFELNEQIKRAFKEIFTDKIPALNIKFITFSSSVFKKIQRKQQLLNLYEKILPSNNQQQILQNVDNDGGRSGQFFFFNYDKTIIIKTITNDELGVLRERIEEYYLHFEANPQSFIVKILGLYRALNPQTQEQISFMLMRNILRNIPKRYILKSYDMKGSSYQRQVLKNKQIRESDSVQTSRTLKDVDFKKLEKKVYISLTDSQEIKKTIDEDVKFLCSQGLIDYSLILIKLNQKQFREQCDIEIQGIKMYHSTKQQGVAYIFGIIDYLQTWNIRKMGEKWYKSIFHKRESISSQDPVFYAQRFMKNLITTILP